MAKLNKLKVEKVSIINQTSLHHIHQTDFKLKNLRCTEVSNS